MRERRVRWATWLISGSVVSALGSMAPPLAGAQPPTPVGGEFQVNTYTTAQQGASFVASDSDGDFVVVWHSQGSSATDTDSYSIQGQRYASNGSTQGAQFQVNAYTTNGQFLPSVGADSNGDFVVVWRSQGSPGTDTSNDSVQGQRYASNGSAQGAQFQVNTYTTGDQLAAFVAAEADGDFVVVWRSNGSSGTDTSYTSIQGQRYASSGSTQGAQFQVNSYTTFEQSAPSVATDSDGDFVVVWQSRGSSGSDTSSYSIQAQRYASDGLAQGAEFQVNTYTTNGQFDPFVAADSDGDFVVAWHSQGSSGTDTSIASIQAQRYASDGSAQGAEFQVNTYTTNLQQTASVAAGAGGGFVVTWVSAGSAGGDTSSLSVQGQRYTSNGATQGAQFQVNTYTMNLQAARSVAAESGEDFVVVWDSDGSFGTDTSLFSIHGQRYSVPDPPAPVPAMSSATRFALGAVLLALGAASACRRVSRRSRFSR